MFPRVIQSLSGRTLARWAARSVALSISALLQFSVLVMIAVSAFTGVNISVGESAQRGVVAQVEVGGGEVWANAQDTVTGSLVKNTPTQSDKDEVWKTITSIVNGFIGIFFFVATPFLMLVWWLMTPDWVFGEIFGFRPVLHSLWVLVSNIVYVIFAFLLVVMAFMNIFAGEKNTWAIKAKLPKLIVGVISVPFTWFFVSAVVSISSVLTASAIQLAGDLVPNGSEFEVPRYECTLDFNKNPVEKNANGNSVSPEICKKVGTPKPLSEYLKSGEAYGLVSYYAYGIFQIQDIKKLTDTKLKTVKTVLDMGVGLLLALIIFVIFALIIIALVVALLTRAIYFWAIAVCSPLLSLAYFFDGKIGFWESWLSPRKIIDLAMVPVYVALALALGLVFISAVGSTPDLKLKSDYVKNVSTTDTEQTFTILDNTITVKGDPLGATAVIKDAKSLGGGVLGGFLIKILALCIMWFAVMAAFKSSKITGDMVEPISKFGSEIGGMIKKLPQYVPIIPTGHGKASLSSLWNISSRVSGDIQNRQNQVGQDIGSSISKAMGIAGKETVTAIQRAGATPPADVSQAAGVVTNMMKAADATDRAQFISPAKRQEREAMAKVIENNFAWVIKDEPTRKKIADWLRSQSDQLIEQALKDLEHNLSGSSLWGTAGVELWTKDGQDVWIKSLKARAETSSWNIAKPVSGSIANIASTNVELKITVEASGNIEFPNQKQLKDAISAAQGSLNGSAKDDYKKARLSEIKTALEAKNIPKINIDKLIWEL